jgi:hypothetical protein
MFQKLPLTSRLFYVLWCVSGALGYRARWALQVMLEDGGRSLLRNVVNFRVLYICILHFIIHFIHIKRRWTMSKKQVVQNNTIYPSETFKTQPSFYVPPEICDTKFHTHTKVSKVVSLHFFFSQLKFHQYLISPRFLQDTPISIYLFRSP